MLTACRFVRRYGVVMNPRHFQILSAICDLPPPPSANSTSSPGCSVGRPPPPDCHSPRQGWQRVSRIPSRPRPQKPPGPRSPHGPPRLRPHPPKTRRPLEAHFRGGVKPSHFKNAAVQFWLPASGADTPVGRTASTPPPLPQLPITNYPLTPLPHRHLAPHPRPPPSRPSPTTATSKSISPPPKTNKNSPQHPGHVATPQRPRQKRPLLRPRLR